MTRDVWALIASFTYVAIVVGAAELVRRRAGLGVDFTRKVVHVGVGVWIVPTLFLFEHWWMAIVPPGAFILLNAISYKFSVVGAMEEEGTGNLGTILFPIAFVLLIAVFWPLGRPDVIAGGILVLALGDAGAALVGRRYGRRHYRIGSSTRSLEGSITMVVLSFAALVLTRWLFPNDVSTAALLGVAVLAGFLEGVSLWGFDNLLVPVGTAVALFLVA